jgi:Polysaccharide deacetylase
VPHLGSEHAVTKTQNRLLGLAMLVFGGAGVALGVPIIAMNAQDWVPNHNYTKGQFIHPDGGQFFFMAYTSASSGAALPVWCTTANCTTTEDGGNMVWYQYTLDRQIYCPGWRNVPIFCQPSLDGGNNVLVFDLELFSNAPVGSIINVYGDGVRTPLASASMPVTTSCTGCEITVPAVALPILPCSDLYHSIVVNAVDDAGTVLGIDSKSFRVDYLASDGGQDTGLTVSLTFDDSFDDQYNITEPLLRDAGLIGTFFVNWPRMHGLIRGGSASQYNYQQGYMLPSQVKSIVSRGHEAGEHTLNHRHLDCLGFPDQSNEIWNNRTFLIGDGLGIRYTAYPFGGDNPGTHLATLLGKQVGGRDIGGTDNTAGYCGTSPSCTFPGCPYAETIPPKDMYTWRAWNSLGPNCQVIDPEEAIQNAEDAGGGWMIINAHHICEFGDGGGCVQNTTVLADGGSIITYDAGIPSPTLAWPVENEAIFLKWLAARSGIGTHVVPVYQVVGGSVFGLSPWDAGPIKNADLEDYSSGGASCTVSVQPLPDCFEDVSTSLDASYVFTRSTISKTGTWATLITANWITSPGAVREVITHSVPASSEYYCPRTVVDPTKNYTVSVWYQSNCDTQLTLYSYETSPAVFNFDAGWTTLRTVTVPYTTTSSTPIPDAGGYMLASYSITEDGGFPLPADAIWISFGMSDVCYDAGSFLLQDTYNITQP